MQTGCCLNDFNPLRRTVLLAYMNLGRMRYENAVLLPFAR